MGSEVFIASKTCAQSFEQALNRSITDATIQTTALHFPLEQGGECVEFELRRKSEVVVVAVFLGDHSSPIGPFDGDCWILVQPIGWFISLKRHQLFQDICRAVEVHGGYLPVFDKTEGSVRRD